MADTKSHTLKFKVGDIDIEADVYRTDAGTLYCKDTDGYIFPQRFYLDFQEIIGRLSNLEIGLGKLKKFEIKEVQ